mmetsp:Transcript_86927/g.218823  ORF Transcript_86927/g.218823 Transcript_86927/m.218823 type:complete len:279 (-) Transcript_86927:769-1605(-)
MWGVDRRLSSFGLANLRGVPTSGATSTAFVGVAMSFGAEQGLEESVKNPSIKIPAMMPVWMEYVKGTTVIVRKLGMATRRLSQSMPRHGAIMKAPIKTSGTAVATCGTALRSGPMKADKKKRMATTIAIKPVLAPSTIPALLSLAMITGLVPSSAPAMVPSPADAKMEVLLGTPPSRKRPAMPIKPYCTPARSKRATKSMTRLPINMAGSFPLPGAQASKLTAKEESNRGIETRPAGGSARPTHQAQMAMAQMPIKSAPWISPTTNMAEMRQNPASAK